MNLRLKFREHFRENRIQYCMVAALFTLGLIMGALKAGDLEGGVKERLLEMIDLYLGEQQGVYGPAVFVSALLNQGRFILAIWALGLTVIGIPLILAVVFMRGFSLGFTAGFLFQEKAAQGVLLTFISLLPQNLIYVPVLLIASVIAVDFSLYIVRGRSYNRAPLGVSLLGYTSLVGMLMLVFMLGAFIEAYLVSWLLDSFIK
ncbi:MAG: stage II sporulation protein M [Syntrophomonadaceae bacterium]|jgi:stage II sporulation protein M|nr:stage II sporulation protein M [Syntrophomonadaceae bacterium]